MNSRPTVALLARIFDVNITYSFCNGHNGVQSTRVDVNQGGNHKLMALPVRMRLATKSGAHADIFLDRLRSPYSEAPRIIFVAFLVANMVAKQPVRLTTSQWALKQLQAECQHGWTGVERKKCVHVSHKKDNNASALQTCKTGLEPRTSALECGLLATRPPLRQNGASREKKYVFC